MKIIDDTCTSQAGGLRALAITRHSPFFGVQ